MLTENVGAVLRSARQALGLTQKELAGRAGVSERLWAEVERGARPNVSLETALRMLSEVGVTVRLDSPLGSTHLLHDPAGAAKARAARAVVRRKTWSGRQIRLHDEGADHAAREGAAGIEAVARVTGQAFAVAQARRAGRR